MFSYILIPNICCMFVLKVGRLLICFDFTVRGDTDGLRGDVSECDIDNLCGKLNSPKWTRGLRAVVL